LNGSGQGILYLVVDGRGARGATAEGVDDKSARAERIDDVLSALTVQRKLLESEGDKSSIELFRVPAVVVAMETCGHIDQNVVTNKGWKYAAIMSKQENGIQVEGKSELREAAVKFGLEFGTSNAMLNIVIFVNTTKRTGLFLESKSPMGTPLVQGSLHMGHM